MHELAICQELVNTLTEIADRERADSISEIYLSIGPLSGVEPALLENAFPIAAADSVACSAVLHLQQQPVRVVCEHCGCETEAAVNRLLCAECKDWRVRLISGDELLLERVCLEREDQRRLH